MKVDEMVLSVLTERFQNKMSLAKRLGITERTFRRAIHRLRCEGYPIIASARTSGYKMGTPEEAKQLANEFEHRAIDMLAMADNLRGII